MEQVQKYNPSNSQLPCTQFSFENQKLTVPYPSSGNLNMTIFTTQNKKLQFCKADLQTKPFGTVKQKNFLIHKLNKIQIGKGLKLCSVL